MNERLCNETLPKKIHEVRMRNLKKAFKEESDMLRRKIKKLQAEVNELRSRK